MRLDNNKLMIQTKKFKTNILEFNFSRVTFTNASKYVFLIATQSQTKRTEICNSWTSSPIFTQSLLIQQSATYTLKGCEATLDRKLKIIGQTKIQSKNLNFSNFLIFDEDLQLIQTIEGKPIVVGRFHLQVTRQSENSHKFADNSSKQEDLQQFQLRSNDSDEEIQNDSSIKLYVHGGVNFFLGTSFAVQAIWGLNESQSHFVKQKLNPEWGQSLNLVGSSKQHLIVNIIDKNNNILEWIKIPLQNVKKMFPYHLKLIFREQYMGQRPIIYFSFIRQDIPLYSVLDKQIELVINHDGSNLRSPMNYLVIQNKIELQIPKFVEINLGKITNFDQVNKLIQNLQIGDYNWIDFIPLQNGKKSINVNKSQMNQKLTLFLVQILNWKFIFQNSEKRKENGWKIIQKRDNFQKILKKIYYHDEAQIIGKVTQIYSKNYALADLDSHNTNKWKALTNNYILRNNLLNTTIKNIEVLNMEISSKGNQLIKLKKILGQVQYLNNLLKQKEKSTIIQGIFRKQRLSQQNYKITDIQVMLYEKQAQLDYKKKLNNQMVIRMEALDKIQQDSHQVDQIIIKNSKKLLEQQQKLKLLKKIKRQIPKQKQILLRLQKIFEQKQNDKEMNQILKCQNLKLEQIRKRKGQQLQKVYSLIKEKNNKTISLSKKIQDSEKQLIRLNQYYVSLMGL